MPHVSSESPVISNWSVDVFLYNSLYNSFKGFTFLLMLLFRWPFWSSLIVLHRFLWAYIDVAFACFKIKIKTLRVHFSLTIVCQLPSWRNYFYLYSLLLVMHHQINHNFMFQLKLSRAFSYLNRFFPFQ